VTSGTSSPEVRPDYRFTLANERTFLSYVRTALALDAAGLAVAQFLTDLRPEWLRQLLAISLVVAGVVVAVAAYRRWSANESAMRQGAPLPPTSMPLGLAAGAALLSIAALILVLVS
jgi:putative membrane protein